MNKPGLADATEMFLVTVFQGHDPDDAGALRSVPVVPARLTTDRSAASLTELTLCNVSGNAVEALAEFMHCDIYRSFPT